MSSSHHHTPTPSHPHTPTPSHSHTLTGSELTLFVTTDLDTDGSFWAHQEATPPYEALFEQLQDRTSEIKDQYTPVFFTEGNLCTAQFSEDDSWYRGRIEGSKDQEVRGGGVYVKIKLLRNI